MLLVVSQVYVTSQYCTHARLPPTVAALVIHLSCHIQVLALFNKAIRKLHGHLRAIKEAAVDRQLPKPAQLIAATAAAAGAGDAPLLGEGVDVGLDQELEEAAQLEREKMREQFRPEDLQQFAISGRVLCCFRAGRYCAV